VEVGDREKRWGEGESDTSHGPKVRVMMEVGPHAKLRLFPLNGKGKGSEKKRTCKRTGVRGNATCVTGTGCHVALRVRARVLCHRTSINYS